MKKISWLFGLFFVEYCVWVNSNIYMALHMLGKRFTIELHPQLNSSKFFIMIVWRVEEMIKHG